MSAEKKRILIVEDEKIIAEDIKRTLISYKYDVVSIVSTGEEAVEIAGKQRPDLILMDIMLQGDMTGLTAAEIIYKNYNIPVIFLTAYSNDEILAKAALSSPFGYLIKPFEDRELQVNVEMAFYKYEMEQVLKYSRNLLLKLIDTVPNYISLSDSDSKYVLSNKAFADSFDTTPKKIPGKTEADLIGDSDIERIQVQRHLDFNRQVFRTGKTLVIEEEQITLKNGMQRWFQTTKTPMRTPDQRNAVLSVAVDITERKKTTEALAQSNIKLQKLFEETVNGLVSAMEKRDPYTAGHQRRVANLATAIAEEMNLSIDQTAGIRIAALVHDIGKIYVPSEILSKPGELSRAEMNLIRTHPAAGHEILSKIHFPWPVAEIVLQHQERLDGSGYPQGLKSDDIILEARILSVADVVEAISSHRPYRPALGVEFALNEIISHKGTLYDSQVVDACIILFKEKKFEFEFESRWKQEIDIEKLDTRT
ncbi:MAG: HD domain-containing phosphohydrolase [Candidatus Cloacimonadales bacterium]|nr:HD domain-containing phosphohydrolase [Candidatus Cloacimonadales bacterium]